MVLTIPQYNGRVSPVFDVAGQLLVVDIKHAREVGRHEVPLQASRPLARAREVAGLGADVLICGAISRELEVALVSIGVRVIPHAVGEVDGVVAAFIGGRLPGVEARPVRTRSGISGDVPEAREYR